jgi:hypothetical protein
MPGTDPREATNMVVGEFGALPHVVELPARGPGGDAVGRTGGLLADVDRSFEIETSTTGWRLGHTGQSALRRARTWLAEDLEAFEEFAAGSGGDVKVQIVGPWTLAARIEDAAGESLIRDFGAVAELAGAVGEAAGELVVRVRRAVPNARVVCQVDEPELRRVLDGRVRMSSGRLFHRSVEPAVAEGHLSMVVAGIVDRGGVAAIRCATERPPVDVLTGSGAQVIGVDLELGFESPEVLPQLWESGVGLLLGCVPTSNPLPRTDTAASSSLRRFMSEAGFSSVPENVAITARTGLGHLDATSARTVMDICNRVGSIVRDEHPEVSDG